MIIIVMNAGMHRKSMEAADQLKESPCEDNKLNSPSNEIDSASSSNSNATTNSTEHHVDMDTVDRRNSSIAILRQKAAEHLLKSTTRMDDYV